MINLNLSYIIADDDPVYRESTVQHLQLIPNLSCMAICDTAIAVNAALQNGHPDLLILDVEMPGLSGMQLAKSLTHHPFIIFISSHPHYAVDAFEVDAVDFLVKPVPLHRLMRAVEKARLLQEMKNTIPVGEGFQKMDDEAFFIKDKSQLLKINYADVVYMESLGDFVNIFLEKGEKKIALVNLKSLEQQLPASTFLRISRTHMLNKKKITAIGADVVVLDKIQLSIGKTYVEMVMQQIVGDKVIKRFV